MTIVEATERLAHLVTRVPPVLEQIDEGQFAFKPIPDKWSKKEILGHLIDSAANNHQRFIRIQYENEPLVFYNQNKWNELSNYNSLNKSHLIHFWQCFNQHLVEIIKTIPKENLDRNGLTKDGQKLSLHFYIIDYVDHLEHHLKQLIEY